MTFQIAIVRAIIAVFIGMVIGLILRLRSEGIDSKHMLKALRLSFQVFINYPVFFLYHAYSKKEDLATAIALVEHECGMLSKEISKRERKNEILRDLKLGYVLKLWFTLIFYIIRSYDEFVDFNIDLIKMYAYRKKPITSEKAYEKSVHVGFLNYFDNTNNIFAN